MSDASDILRKIQRADVEWAVGQVREEGVPSGREATTYSLLVDGKEYPPKYVLALAAGRVAGRVLQPHEHSGGSQTNDRLAELGFRVVGRAGAATPASQVLVWKLIAHHKKAERDGVIEWQDTSRAIAVGWGRIGDLRDAKFADSQSISAAIKESYPELRNASTGGPSLWNFARRMNVGDLVIVVGARGRSHVVEVAGPYVWASARDSLDDYMHQREAVLTDHDTEELWAAVGKSVESGQSPHLTVARCGVVGAVAGSSSTTYVDGGRVEVVMSRVERDPRARRDCLAHYGPTCVVCDMRFADRYGPEFKRGIHVHHLIPLSESSSPREVDPVRDLRPLCPNCHAAVHQRKPPYTPDELRALLARSGEE